MELVDSLKARFDNITGDAAGVAKWSQAFNNNDWPVSDTDKLEEWGHVDVMEMAEKYSKFLTTENEDAADMKEKAIEQWTDFKEIVAPYMKPGDGFQAQFGGGAPQAQPAVVLGEGSEALVAIWRLHPGLQVGGPHCLVPVGQFVL